MNIENQTRKPVRVGHYSPAVSAAGLLFISGQLPIDPATGTLVAQNFAEQTKRCLSNIEAILFQNGLTKDDIVKTTCFLADIDGLSEMNESYASTFTGVPAPARVALAVRDLPQGALVEIEAIAAFKA